MRKMLLAATGIAVGLNLIPIATLANDHDLVCYMVTGRGDVIDLGSFCRRDSQPARISLPSSTPANSSRSVAVQAPTTQTLTRTIVDRHSDERSISLHNSWVEVTGTQINGNRVTGVLHNRGGKEAFNLQIAYSVLNNQNRVIDTGIVPSTSRRIAAGSRQDFSLATGNGGGEIQNSGTVVFRLTWQEYAD